MDEQRMHSLIEKATTTGLSDAEANELGRLYAEAAAKPYANAADLSKAATRQAGEWSMRLRMERKMRRRRWPFSMFESRRYTKARSLEIGQTATPPEDMGQAA